MISSRISRNSEVHDFPLKEIFLPRLPTKLFTALRSNGGNPRGRGRTEVSSTGLDSAIMGFPSLTARGPPVRLRALAVKAMSEDKPPRSRSRQGARRTDAASAASLGREDR